MSGSTKSAETLVGRLCERLASEPDRIACTYVASDGSGKAVTVRELMERAAAFAKVFGPATTERHVVGVCLYHSVDLHAAFIGGLLSGHIPTMLAPPSPRMEPAKYSDSFRQMLTHVAPS